MVDFTFLLMAEEFDPFAEATPEEEAAKAEAAAAAPKKEKKEKAVGKSTLVLAIKPADTEIDLDALEAKVRAIQMDGLLWGISERKEMCFGLIAIHMGAVVTDDVSIDDLQEEIESWDEEVASTEILAFQKI